MAALQNGWCATIDRAWGSALALVSAALGLHGPASLVILLARLVDVDDSRDEVMWTVVAGRLACSQLDRSEAGSRTF